MLDTVADNLKNGKDATGHTGDCAPIATLL